MLPNFLIIGAAKAGTTSLWDYLSHHPQVYMPRKQKEANFFALEGTRPEFKGPGDDHWLNRIAITNLEDYEALFEGVTDQVAIGEASPLYMYHPDAPRRIKAYIPSVKIVAILRNPAERAYSSYLHLLRDGREPSHDFAEALRLEAGRISAGWEHIWHYQAMGFYYAQLRRYYDLFSRDQIKIIIFSDLATNERAVLKGLMRFLEIGDIGTGLKRMNTSAGVEFARSAALHGLIAADHPIKRTAKRLLPSPCIRAAKTILTRANSYSPRFALSVRRELVRAFHEDVKNLGSLIDRDLSPWGDS